MIRALVAILFLSVLLPAEQSLQKAVFDCASGNMQFVASRIKLIEASAKEFEASKTPYEFVLTVHGNCAQIVGKANDQAQVKSIQIDLERLYENYNVEIEVCELAMNGWGYEKEDLLPVVDIVHNSITRVIRLQNDGYAFFPFH